MITLKEFLIATDYKVTEVYNYQWVCYGPRAANMSFVLSEPAATSSSVSIVYDLSSQVAYELEAWDAVNGREYRWINPEFRKAHEQEANSRGVDMTQSYDDHKFIDLETEEDILEKLTAIAQNRPYDERVIVPLNMTDAELVVLALAAHKADVTLNEYVVSLLVNMLEQENAKPLKCCKKKCCKAVKSSRDAEQAAFEAWLEDTSPSGDVDAVQRQWENSLALSEYLDEQDKHCKKAKKCKQCN